eukprot:1318766-Amorphochlora_amoeboformis.AAC.3
MESDQGWARIRFEFHGSVGLNAEGFWRGPVIVGIHREGRVRLGYGFKGLGGIPSFTKQNVNPT